MSTLDANANVTVNIPIFNGLSIAKYPINLMNTNLLVIIIFLVILSSQMIYALMLSDIDMKTFDFGILRALGFNKYNITSTILI